MILPVWQTDKLETCQCEVCLKFAAFIIILIVGLLDVSLLCERSGFDMAHRTKVGLISTES